MDHPIDERRYRGAQLLAVRSRRRVAGECHRPYQFEGIESDVAAADPADKRPGASRRNAATQGANSSPPTGTKETPPTLSASNIDACLASEDHLFRAERANIVDLVARLTTAITDAGQSRLPPIRCRRRRPSLLSAALTARRPCAGLRRPSLQLPIATILCQSIPEGIGATALADTVNYCAYPRGRSARTPPRPCIMVITRLPRRNAWTGWPTASISPTTSTPKT
jgi:hypothetical protein